MILSLIKQLYIGKADPNTINLHQKLFWLWLGSRDIFRFSSTTEFIISSAIYVPDQMRSRDWRWFFVRYFRL
jgi:hypothetical protein